MAIKTTYPKFARIPKDLTHDPKISANAKVLFAILDDWSGYGTPTIEQMGESMGMRETAVRRARKELEDAGWITVEEVHGPSGRLPNDYTLHAQPRKVAQTPRLEEGGVPSPSEAPSPSPRGGVLPIQETVETKTGSPKARPSLEMRPGTAALVAAWVEGTQAVDNPQPQQNVKKFGTHARALVKELGLLPDVTSTDWRRALDTAYLLGTKAVFPIVAAYYGVDGRDPDLPKDGRYILGSAGTVVPL